MSDLTADEVPITKQTLDSASNAARAALDAAIDARAYFLGLDARDDYARRCERAAALLTRLGDAACQTRAVEIVERAFTNPAGVSMAGVGSETNAHRLALRLAGVTFDAITSGVLELIVSAQESLFEKAIAARKAGQEASPDLAALCASMSDRRERFEYVLAGRPRRETATFSAYGSKKPKQLASSVYRLVPTDYTIRGSDVADVLPPRSPWRWLPDALSLPAEPDRQGFAARIRAEYLTGLRFAERRTDVARASTEATPSGENQPADETPADDAEQAAAQDLARLAALLGDDNALKMFSVINNSALSVEQKQQALCAIDRRILGWDGKRWSTLLGVSEQAARKTDWWNVERKRLRGGD